MKAAAEITKSRNYCIDFCTLVVEPHSAIHNTLDKDMKRVSSSMIDNLVNNAGPSDVHSNGWSSPQSANPNVHAQATLLKSKMPSVLWWRHDQPTCIFAANPKKILPSSRPGCKSTCANWGTSINEATYIHTLGCQS